MPSPSQFAKPSIASSFANLKKFPLRSGGSGEPTKPVDAFPVSFRPLPAKFAIPTQNSEAHTVETNRFAIGETPESPAEGRVLLNID